MCPSIETEVVRVDGVDWEVSFVAYDEEGDGWNSPYIPAYIEVMDCTTSDYLSELDVPDDETLSESLNQLRESNKVDEL